MQELSKQAQIAFQWAADLAPTYVIDSIEINDGIIITSTLASIEIYDDYYQVDPCQNQYTKEEFDMLLNLLQNVQDLQQEIFKGE